MKAGGQARLLWGLTRTAEWVPSIYPMGAEVTLRAHGNVAVRRVVDLTTRADVKASWWVQSEGTFVIDPPGNVPEALLILDLG